MMNGSKRVIGIAMVVSMTFATVGCGAAKNANAAEQVTQEEQMIGMPNPFADVNSLEEASKIAGFDMSAPNSVDGYNGMAIQAIEKDLIQVIYGDQGHNVYFRKAVGIEDVSGDYNQYKDVSTKSLYGKELTVKSEDEKTYVITWTDGQYSYSIQSNDGFDFADVQALLEN